jgi:hypothetical protein
MRGMSTPNGITSCAQERLIAAIRNEVAAEFADRLARAKFWQRLRIRLAMMAEVRRRTKQLANGRNLYSKA